MSTHTRNESGDTIVEVLISIGVITSVLVGAFVSANGSLSMSQQSQERGEAVRMAEQQLEQLKAAAATSDVPSIFATAHPSVFCFQNSGAKAPLGTGFNPDLVTDNFGAYQAAGINCTGGLDGRYKFAIQRNASNSNSFAVTVRWDKAGRGGREEVKMLYRVYS